MTMEFKIRKNKKLDNFKFKGFMYFGRIRI